MPTVLNKGSYRFFFYSADGVEPPHVHIERDNKIAKFWLEPVMLQNKGGFSSSEIRRIARIVEENQSLFTEAWSEFFDS